MAGQEARYGGMVGQEAYQARYGGIVGQEARYDRGLSLASLAALDRPGFYYLNILTRLDNWHC